MPAKWFNCPDNKTIPIANCLEKHGCRMKERCSTLPYLRLISYDREYRGITPSMAGSDACEVYLKATTDYAISPQGRVFAALGVGVHGKLSIHSYTHNVLSEEKLSDEKTSGIADLLEEDEFEDGKHILTDHKTWGSFKVAKVLGILKVDTPVLDDKGDQLYYGKTAKKAGQAKTRKVIEHHPDKTDRYDVELQTNRYRIFFEKYGFPISRIQVQVYVRDGGLVTAFGRGIDKNMYVIPIRKLPNMEVLNYYDKLTQKVRSAFEMGYAPLCGKWENWDFKKCEGWCDVKNVCDKTHPAGHHNEKNKKVKENG